MRYLILFALGILFVLSVGKGFADPLTITRTTPGTVTCVGDTYVYHSSVQGNTHDWNITGGTIILDDGNDVSVVWTSSSGRLSQHVVVRVRVCNDPDPCVWEETDYDGFIDVTATAISATLSASPTSVCPGQPVNLTASSNTGNITWSGGGLDGLTGTNQTVSPATTTTYTITTINGGCTLSKSVTVYVQNNTPGKPADPTVSQNTCDAKTLHAPTAPPSGVTWYWQTAEDGTEMSQTSATDFVAENSGTYYLRSYRDLCGWGLSTAVTVTVKKGIDCQEEINYIISTNVLVSGITTQQQIETSPVEDVSRTIAYFDGLGRAMQQVGWQQTPHQKDLIAPVVYDNLGRQPLQYLPFVDSQKDHGRYQTVTFQPDNNYSNNFYNTPSDKIADDARPFTETQYEASPLNRPLRQFGAGKAWSDNNKFIGFEYKLNAYGTEPGQEKIVAYALDENGQLAKRPVVTGYIETGGYYSTNQLFIKVTTDEQGNAVREYTNKSGHVVLKKVQAVAGSTDLNNLTEWAFTYYVYDDRNNLVMVVPPEAVRILGN